MGNKKCIRFIQLLAIRSAIGNMNNVKVSNCEIPLVSDYLKSNKKTVKFASFTWIAENHFHSSSWICKDHKTSSFASQINSTIPFRIVQNVQFNEIQSTSFRFMRWINESWNSLEYKLRWAKHSLKQTVEFTLEKLVNPYTTIVWKRIHF